MHSCKWKKEKKIVMLSCKWKKEKKRKKDEKKLVINN